MRSLALADAAGVDMFGVAVDMWGEAVGRPVAVKLGGTTVGVAARGTPGGLGSMTGMGAAMDGGATGMPGTGGIGGTMKPESRGSYPGRCSKPFASENCAVGKDLLIRIL